MTTATTKPPKPYAPGETIADKYAITRVLGEGGMGLVYEATHVRLRQRVAVKVLHVAMLEHPIVVARFEREARAAAQLRGRHVARVSDVDVTASGLPYMVMELLEGNDLETELTRRGSLPEDEAVDLVLQVCAAMNEAHRLGIVHRDLKPANVFLADDEEQRIAKVLDFGISKTTADPQDVKLTAADTVMGTALYMSPEQVRGTASVDARADLWALGVMLYELVSGAPPWNGTPTQLAAAVVSEDPPDLLARCAVSPGLAAVVVRCLRRDPAERFTDVRELAIALAPFAPPLGLGRAFADACVATGTGPHARLASRPSLPVLPEPARARSEATAPGWSKHDASRGGPRSLLVPMLAAFGVGLVVIGLGAYAYVSSSARPRPAAVAVAPASAPAAVASVGPVASVASGASGGVAPGSVASSSSSSSPTPTPSSLSPSSSSGPSAAASSSAAAAASGPSRARPPRAGRPVAPQPAMSSNDTPLHL